MKIELNREEAVKLASMFNRMTHVPEGLEDVVEMSRILAGQTLFLPPGTYAKVYNRVAAANGWEIMGNNTPSPEEV